MSPRSVLLVLGITALLAVGLYGYTKLLARVGSGTPPMAAAAASLADHIVVSKADKAMYLFRDDRILRRYRISMGSNWKDGHKQREGDERTPEGAYVIDWRNPNSMAHLSLHISYPNAADQEAARRQGYHPGGNIMIHGLPNGWGALGAIHHLLDWTDGCIAVSNAEMREIWSLVPNGTPIEIHARWQP
ncbi:murein L,D-transpeptidase family protein [Nitratireductor sp. ZSWI3]|uniref:L,D-transpeptidase family protein n=1 Tax=Nitratireductor sp. ZSWI3 TaxID=2966359 RepID=UPI0021501CDC|nr:L,D-transpeptidase family protein [Nitratireductor sp. ZSWI3]MCR4264905.1 L,D-transpeptidase family protein [Nitratireductor sp. ZSWI3]